NTHGILVPVVVLLCIGIIMVYSSSAFMSTEKYGNSLHYLWKHLFTVLIGFIGMIFFVKLDYQDIKKFAVPLLIFSFILLILVFVPGIGMAAGAKSTVKRWINMRLLTFQPSELVKIAIVIFLSKYISKNANRMNTLRYGIIIPIAVMVVFQGIILLQPDFGAAMSIGIITLTLLIIGGIRWRYIVSVIAVSIPAVIALIIAAPYRLKRILAFIDPWKDSQGTGYQLIQSFYAFGMGWITGVGIGSSKQKLYFLPEAHTDFIFSLIGEETGLIGAVIVVGLFVYLLIRGFKIAMQTEDSFGYYLAIGLTVMIGSQALINFAVSTGLMPTKGLPLPFISYGGSALLVNMMAVGILINISKNCRSPLIRTARFQTQLGSKLSRNADKGDFNYISMGKPGGGRISMPVSRRKRYK
ncbi:MAG: putative lipid II flippase FtsW, partial [Nitrospirota bacterium]